MASLLLRNLTSKLKPLPSIPSLPSNLKSNNNNTLSKILPSFRHFTTTTENKEKEDNNNNNNNTNNDNGGITLKLDPEKWSSVPMTPWEFDRIRKGTEDDGIGDGPFAIFKRERPYPYILAFDMCWRKHMRTNFHTHLRNFGSHPSFQDKHFTCLQIAVFDEIRHIEETMFYCNPKLELDDPEFTEISRKLFRVAASSMMNEPQGPQYWVSANSLVFKPCDSKIDEAIEFSSFDPIGGLDIIEGVDTQNVKEDEVWGMLTEAVKALDKEPEVPLGFRCSEELMCIVGDYAFDDGGLNNLEAVPKFLRELNTDEGVLKIQGCAVVCGSSKADSFEARIAITEMFNRNPRTHRPGREL